MIPYAANDMIIFVSLSMTVLGILSILVGMGLLVSQATTRALSSLATETANLAQKGIAEDVAGLVGNARALVDALNDLVRTRAGIGIFMVAAGFLMLLAAFLIVRPV